MEEVVTTLGWCVEIHAIKNHFRRTDIGEATMEGQDIMEIPTLIHMGGVDIHLIHAVIDLLHSTALKMRMDLLEKVAES